MQQRAETLGTFRWIAVRMMRQLAEWVPTTAEMEVKVLFGRHVWDCARHADAFGKRAFELRAPLQYTLPAMPAYRTWLDELGHAEGAADRVCALYDVMLPALRARYAAYAAATDALMDEPSVRVIESAIADHVRMRTDRERLLAGVSLPQPTFAAAAWREREAAIDPIVEFGEGVRAKGIRA